MMYLDLLKDHIIDFKNEDHFNWHTAVHMFVRSCCVSKADIDQAEQRLLTIGYHLPSQLKAFWLEIGCGYLCPNFLADNVLEDPKAIIDVYFSEGDWAQVKTSFNLLVPNELPFFRTSGFNYITIGLEEGGNWGKILFDGEQIADCLYDFIEDLLQNPLYYQQLLLTK